jgi:hypothetical protein
MDNAQTNLSKYSLLEELITELQAFAHCMGYDSSTDAVLDKIKREFDSMGPYEFAKSRNLLVNGSGEEFACQFMEFYNEYAGVQVY